jgi:putative chitinase
MDIKQLQQRLKDAGFFHADIGGHLGKITYSALLSYIAGKELGDKGLAIGEGCVAFLPAAGITTGLRLAHFLAQAATETGAFKSIEENLNYSAKNLMDVWPNRFPNLAATAGLVMNPKALALKVYSNRLGNGAPASGDGWIYRGRGLIQLTGRSNYTAREAETGIPLVAHPEFASDPKISVQIASLYWTSRNINPFADADDLTKVRKAVNGGKIGLDDAAKHLKRAKKILL